MEQLIRLRELKGYSQRALAKASGVSPATIYELENGRRRPNPSTLRKLAQGLEVEVADLLRKAGGKPLLTRCASGRMRKSDLESASRYGRQQGTKGLAMRSAGNSLMRQA